MDLQKIKTYAEGILAEIATGTHLSRFLSQCQSQRLTPFPRRFLYRQRRPLSVGLWQRTWPTLSPS